MRKGVLKNQKLISYFMYGISILSYCLRNFIKLFLNSLTKNNNTSRLAAPKDPMLLVSDRSKKIYFKSKPKRMNYLHQLNPMESMIRLPHCITKVPLLFSTIVLLLLGVFQVQAQTDPDGTPALSANLKLWLDASDISTLFTDAAGTNAVTTDGNTVYNWKDKVSPSTIELVAPSSGNTPTYKATSSFNGQPAVSFNRSESDYLLYDLPSTWQGESTVFIVFELLEDSNEKDSFFSTGNSGTNGAYQIAIKSDDQTFGVRIRANGSGNTEITIEPESQNELKLYSLRQHTNKDFEILTDGNTVGTTTLDTFTQYERYVVNANRGKGSHTTSNIFEVIVYDRALTDCELEEVNLYLGNKYGRDFSGIAVNYDLPAPYDNTIGGIGTYTSECGVLTSKDSGVSGILSVDNPSANDLSGDYLTFAHDKTGFAASIDIPSLYEGRITQVWRVDEDNAVGTVDVEFNLSGLGIDTSNSSDFALLIDTDGVFTDATAYTTGLSIVGDVVSFTGVNFTDGDYISLAIEQAPPPFISSWAVDVSVDADITLPINNSPSGASNYNFTVDWGDGTATESYSGFGNTLQNVTHTYVTDSPVLPADPHYNGSPGYKITISGLFPIISFGGTLAAADKTKIIAIDQWGSGLWKSFFGGFNGCTNLVINATDAPDLSTLAEKRFTNTFKGCTALVDNGGAMGTWNVSLVNNMSSTFEGCTNFNGDISTWDVGTVTTFAKMFINASTFNRNIGNWDTSTVTNMANMFQSAADFNFGAVSETGGVLVNWNTSEVTSMGNMFQGATSFNQNLSQRTVGPDTFWDVSKVASFRRMFLSTKFNNGEIAGSYTTDLLWTLNTTGTINMEFMFNNASKFNQNITSWNTQKVTNLARSFDGATSFDQNLSTWNVEAVTTADLMFNGITLSTANYDALLISWAAQTLTGTGNFHGGNSTYCAGEAARATIDTKWGAGTVADGDLDVDCEAPGGVNSYLSLWLKADAGIAEMEGTSITNWTDQSTKGLMASNSSSDGQTAPTARLTTQTINFNPTIEFDGINNGLDLGSNYIYATNNGLSVYTVIKPKTISSESENVFDFGSTTNKGYGMAYTASEFTMYTSLDDGGHFSDPIGHSFSTEAVLTTFDVDFGTDQSLLINGKSVYNNAITLTQLGAPEIDQLSTHELGGGPFTIGRQSKSLSSLERKFDGNIAELIVYDEKAAAFDVLGKQKIESYLAIKYGISLDQSTATDYIASDGSTKMWDATGTGASGFNKAIFGIGADVGSVLDQRVSKSSNTGAIVTMALDNNFVAANTDASRTTTLADNNFVMLAHNGADLLEVTTGLNAANFFKRTNRAWQVQSTVATQAVHLKFDGYDHTYVVLESSTNDFSSVTTALGTLNANGEVSVTLSKDKFYTLAIPAIAAPGGIQDKLALWLKADAGVVGTTNVSTWQDQSLAGLDFTKVTSIGPNGVSNLRNFNSVLTFDGTINSGGTNDENILEYNGDPLPNVAADTDDFSFFYVIEKNGIGGTNVFVQGRSGSAVTPNILETGGLKHTTDTGFNSVTGAGIVNDELTLFELVRTDISVVPLKNGKAGIAQSIAADNLLAPTGVRTTIGGRDQGIASDGAINGVVGEIIAYSNDVSATDRQQIESYLGLKYGISLDQTSEKDYLASNGSKMWNASGTGASGFNKAIFGIGADVDSGLDQRVSKSITTDAILTLATTADFAAANTDGGRTSLTDLNFQTIANNGGAATWSDTGAPTAYNILGKKWQVQETGTVGTVHFEFNVDATFDVPALIAGTSYYIVIDKNGTGNGFADETIANGGVIALTNSGSLWKGSYNFTGTEQFTLATEAGFDVSGLVYYDEDGAGDLDAGETARLQDVTITLYNDVDSSGTYNGGDTVNTTAVSAADGSYTFTAVVPEDYILLVDHTDAALNNDANNANLTYGATTAKEIAITVSAAITAQNFGFDQAEVSLSVDNATINEGLTSPTVATVTATVAPQTGFITTVTLGYGGDATGSGTDFTAAAGTNANSSTEIAIPAGTTSGNITITRDQDTDVEGDEVVNVDITVAVNAIETGTQQVVVTIADDDASIAYSGTFTETLANDGSVGGTMTATLTGDTFIASTGDLTVSTHYTVANVPAGLTAKVTMTSATVATLSFTGNATAHANTDDIATVTLTFTDAAFTEVTAANTANSSKSDIGIDFNNASSIAYAGNFTETLDNDGSVSGSRTATITGDSFTDANATMSASSYSISNLPAGFTASIAVDAGGTVATLTLTSTATLHTISDGITNLGITFNNAAFTNETAAVIATSSNTSGTITYYDAASIVFAGDYTELPANDGSVTGSRTATITGDLFTDAGGIMNASSYTLSNVPAGLNAVVAVNPGGTEARISISATATTHEATNSISNLGLAFNDGAFATFNAAGVSNNNNSSGSITFYDASGISYTGNFIESVDNDGTITGTRTATLTGDTFTDAGTTLNASSYAITNLPTGLTASVVVNGGGTVATISISGTAAAHASTNNITDLSIAFNDAAFTTLTAAGVSNSSNITGVISYYDVASVAYAGNFTESLDNDGTLTGTRTATLTGDTFTDAGTTLTASSYTITNLPTGLTASIAVNGGGTVATISISGTAAAHASSDNITNLSIVFNDGAFATLNAAGVATSSNTSGTIIYYDGASIVFAGGYTELPANDGSVTGLRTATITGDLFTDAGGIMNASSYTLSNVPAGLNAVVAVNPGGTEARISISATATTHEATNSISNLGLAFNDGAFATFNAAGVSNNNNSSGSITFYDASGISYTGNFIESVNNDGTITGTRTATLTGDTFTDAGGTLTASSYTISNLPTGLTASVVVNGGGTVATINISGTAAAHASTDNITDLSIAFNDAAFTTLIAAGVSNSSNSTGVISYYDVASVAYAGNFTESLDNDGTLTGTRTATLTGDTFTDAGTTLTASSYAITNLPTGLTASIAVNGGGTVATISISGTAAAHANANNITNLSIAFNDAAFSILNAAGVATSSNATGTITYYDTANIVYAGNFTEAVANDGSISGTRTATLTGETFTDAGGTLNASKYAIVNLPAGLTASVAVNGGGTIATINISGSASAHASSDDISNLSIAFNNAAFSTLNAAGVSNTTNTAGSISYFDASGIVYSGNFIESADNDGTITGSRTAALSGDVFTDAGGTLTASSYTISNLPTGLTASVVVNGGGTVATINISGTASAHASTDNITDLSIAFNDAAFTTLIAAGVSNSSNSTGVISYYDVASVAYAGNFTESLDNDGTLTGTRTATLTGDTFTDAGTTLTASSYTITNLPTGLTASVAVNGGGTVATISISGTATAHANANNITNLSIAFNDAAFSILNAAGVATSSNAAGTVTYHDSANIVYASNFTEAVANDGSIVGTRTATLTGDTFTDAGGTLNASKYAIVNLPAGLTASVAVNGGGTIATINISGSASAHASSDDISNLSIAFNNAAFSTLNAAGVSNTTNTAGSISYFDASGIIYAGIFTETTANNGAVTGSRTATLSGDVFTDAGTTLTASSYTISNLPTGLTASVAVNGGGTVATINISGSATAHEDTNDIINLSIAFNDAAFTTLTAAGITNSANTTGAIDYLDASSIVYIGDFTEAGANDGTITGTRTATITGDVFANAGATMPGTSYSISNLPAGLTASIAVNAGGTVATLSLGSTATSHEGTHSITNLGITFNDAAFVNETAANIATSSNATGVITYTHNDDDGDGVVNVNDTCPGTSAGLAVDINGCATIAGIIAASDDPADGGFSITDLDDLPITGLTAANITSYEEAIANAMPAPSSVGDLQTIINAVNTTNSVFIKILEDSASTGGANNTDGTAVTAAELASISGIADVNLANEAAYQTAIQAATGLSNLPTVAEVQAIIDSVNDTIDLVTGADNPADGTPSIGELTTLGITGMGTLTQEDIEETIANAVPQPTTLAELQQLIDDLVTEVADITAIIGQANDPADGTPSLADLTGVGIDVGTLSQEDLEVAIANAIPVPSTVEELQQLVDDLKVEVTAITGIVGQATNPGTGAPSLLDLTNIGISTGTLTQEQIEEEIAKASPQPTTAEELQDLIDALAVEVSVVTGIIGDANDPADGSPSIADLTAIGVTTGTLTQEQIEVAIANAMPVPTTADELQELLDDLEDEVAEIVTLITGANDPADGTPSIADLTAIGVVTGTLTQEQIEEEIANAMPQPTTVAELQELIDDLEVEVTVVTGIIGQTDDPADGTPSIIDLTNIGVVVPGGLTQEQIEETIANADPTPTTVAELQELLEDLEDEVTGIGVLVTNANDPADGNPSITDLTNIGVVVPGELTQEQIEIAITYADPVPTTTAELQELIDALADEVTAITGVIDQANDPADGTPSIVDLTNIGITGIGTLTQEDIEVTIANADPAPTTVAELQQLLDDLLVEVAEVATVVTVATSPSSGTPSIADLTAIGVVDLVDANQSLYEEAIANADPVPSTLSELQAIIDMINSNQAALAELLEDSASTGGGNNGNGIAITSDQLGSIIGLSDINPAYEAAYQAAIQNETGFSNPPTLAEIQALVDQVNIESNVLAEILEDSNSIGGDNNANGTAVTIADLQKITGLENLDSENEAAYQAAIQSAISLSNPPTLAELQSLIDDVNTVENITTVKASDVIGTKNGIRTPWKIAGLEAFPNNKVMVYNKWGKTVLEAKSYQNDWKGFYKENSKPLPEGSYLYVIDLNGDGTKMVTGWIYIGK